MLAAVLDYSARRYLTPLLATLLLSAAAFQWTLGTAGVSGLALGAPAPASWDVGKPGSLFAPLFGTRLDAAQSPPERPSSSAAGPKPLSSTPERAGVAFRVRLLLWGRLLLEGG